MKAIRTQINNLEYLRDKATKRIKALSAAVMELDNDPYFDEMLREIGDKINELRTERMELAERIDNLTDELYKAGESV